MPEGYEKSPTPRKREGSASAGHVTRRQFLIGAGAVGGVLAIGGGTYLAIKGNETDAGSKKLSVSTDQVFNIADLELVDDISEFLKVKREITLDYNTLIEQHSENVLSVMESTGQGSPAMLASTLKISNASKEKILTNVTTDKPRFEVLDFKANDSGYVWIETNVLTGTNIVKSCSSGADVSSAATLLVADSAQKMPQIAIFENSIWVQTSPQDSTSGEKGKLFRAQMGSDENALEEVLVTKSFATPPLQTNSGIVVTPRNSYSTLAYDVRLLDGRTGATLDNLTLPTSMLPQDVSYGATGFSFSFQGSYSYGDGISNVGTYVQGALGTLIGDQKITDDKAEDSEASTLQDMKKDARNTDLSEKPWLGFNREPTCPCAWIGNYVCVKSTSSVAVIDLSSRKYALIRADDGADDYGVWLVSKGSVENLVTLQNINFTSLTGDLVKEGRLKIWGV